MNSYPMAPKKDRSQVIHGHVLRDNYYWLRNKDHKEVKKYLEQENMYLSEYMKNTDLIQDSIYHEILALTNENSETLPYQRNGYWYIASLTNTKDHHVHTRWAHSNTEQKEVYFDENKWIEYFDAYDVAIESISKNNQKLIFSVDQNGSGILDMYILDIEKQKILPDKLSRAYEATWANDNKTIFYIKDDKVTNRSYQLYKHVIGEKDDILIFHEKDDNFSLSIDRSSDYHFIFLNSYSKDENEIWYLNANQDNTDFKLFRKRKENIEYQLCSSNGYFYILTNENAINNKLLKVNVKNIKKKNWVEIIPHHQDIIIEGIDIFKNYLVVSESHNGLQKFQVITLTDDTSYYIPIQQEASYEAWTSENFDFNSDRLRYQYESLRTPESTYEWNFVTKENKLLKSEAVPAYHKEDYHTERIWAPSDDGILVPISLIYNKSKFNKDGTNPLLIEGYGAYGIKNAPYYSSGIFPLLNRGYIYAIAHIRGGGYLGKQWYNQGKLLNKKNTFKDFNACTEYLIFKKYCDPDNVIAIGGSAGGLLMGAIANMKPNLYNSIIAEVPFLDLINTMMDDLLPLTTSEYKEWGNPKVKEYFDYMLSYSPYDNIQQKKYPTMLFITGITDENVPYWEAAKTVAKLRDRSINPKDIFLKTNMGSGHQGASGRYPKIKEKSYINAFILKQRK